MRKLLLAAALAGVLGLAACESRAPETWRNQSGTVALSSDDALVYAIDRDNEIVLVADAKTLAKVAEVKVGAAPEQIAVGPDDTLYVTNRGARSVSVIRRGAWQVADRIPVAVEPVGLALSPDGRTLYVVNSTSLESAEYGTVTAIDTASLQVKWDLAVGEEPRYIALLSADRALVSLHRKGDVVVVDLSRPEIVRDNTKEGAFGTGKGALYEVANHSKVSGEGDSFGTPAGSISTFRPRSAGVLVANPEANHAYLTVTWSREDPIGTRPSTFGGYYAGGGPCGMSAVSTAGLVTYEASTAEPKADDLTNCNTTSEEREYPSSVLFRPSSGFGDAPTPPIQGTSAAVIDPTGTWLFVVNRESNNVAILPTSRRTGPDINADSFGFLAGPTPALREVIQNVGKGPDGIALTRDGMSAFIYAQFDHRLSVLRQKGEGATAAIVVEDSEILAYDPPSMPADVSAGRRLFFAADDPRINDPSTTAVSCNTCHTEGGREDGHVWGFPDGPRQTPSIAGRMMSKTAPFHWNGEFTDIVEFMQHTAGARMGGNGNLYKVEVAQLAAYMDWVSAPDNPHKRAEPTDAQLRGAQVFQQAECNTCHSGAALTDNKFANVGTFSPADDMQKLARGLNTPSLLGVARTAPYLHDGSAATLEERIRMGGDAHGKTSQLTEPQIDDLVAFLKAL
ncbi:MAG: c-type cytochrome [Myxococcaceae bacterium]